MSCLGNIIGLILGIIAFLMYIKIVDWLCFGIFDEEYKFFELRLFKKK
jgi:hypothetical protein